MSIPTALSRAETQQDIEAAIAWSRRHGWTFGYDPDVAQLRAATYHPNARRLVEIVADLDQYPALPPAWRFVIPGTDDESLAAWPLPGQVAGLSGSIFHPKPCICAPWNQLAYSAHGGPHDNWTMTSWRTTAGGYTKADHLPDMLDQIHTHLTASTGFSR